MKRKRGGRRKGEKEEESGHEPPLYCRARFATDCMDTSSKLA